MPRWSNINVRPAGQVASGLPANTADIAQGGVYLTKIRKTCDQWKAASIAEQQYMVQDKTVGLGLSGTAAQTALLQINAFCPPAIAAPGSPAACALPTNSLYNTSGYYDPYFASQATHDLWATQNPTCPAPPAFITGPGGATGYSGIYVPGQSLVSPTCQIQIGLPPTQANAAAWNQANPQCSPVFVSADANGNPILQSTTAILAPPATATFLGMDQNTALITGGVLIAALTIGAVAWFTMQPE